MIVLPKGRRQSVCTCVQNAENVPDQPFQTASKVSIWGPVGSRTGFVTRFFSGGVAFTDGKADHRDNWHHPLCCDCGGAASFPAQRRKPRVLYVNTGRSVAITRINPASTNASMTDSTGLYAIGASS